MNEKRGTVYLVDDDVDVREAVECLLEGKGFKVRAFDRPSALLKAITPEHRGCLVLDVRLPEMCGLDLQREIDKHGIHMPIIFISGHADIATAVRAVHAGAFDFLEKPFHNEVLLEKVENALELDASEHRQQRQKDEINRHLDSLTPREREVMEGLMAGKISKVIAADFEISVRTVELHRARVMEKLGARNSSDVVRIALCSDAYPDWTPS